MSSMFLPPPELVKPAPSLHFTPLGHTSAPHLHGPSCRGQALGEEGLSCSPAWPEEGVCSPKAWASRLSQALELRDLRPLLSLCLSMGTLSMSGTSPICGHCFSLRNHTAYRWHTW